MLLVCKTLLRTILIQLGKVVGYLYRSSVPISRLHKFLYSACTKYHANPHFFVTYKILMIHWICRKFQTKKLPPFNMQLGSTPWEVQISNEKGKKKTKTRKEESGPSSSSFTLFHIGLIRFISGPRTVLGLSGVCGQWAAHCAGPKLPEVS